jgi:allantoicase
MRGAIALYDQDGILAKVSMYEHKQEWIDMIEKWRRSYGNGFKRCIIGITPIANPDDVDINGENCRGEYPLRLDIEKYINHEELNLLTPEIIP